MKVIEHNRIDFSEWDKIILSSENPFVFAQSFYLNATSPGWKALISDDGEAIMPLTEKQKWKIKYLIQPPFTPQLGVFGRLSETTSSQFLEYLKESYRYINIELNHGNCHDLKNEKVTYVIHANQSLSYNENTRRNISKAIKSGIVIQVVEGKEALGLSSELLDPFLSVKLKQSHAHINVFNNLLTNAQEANHLFTLVARSATDEILAIAHFISNGKHAVYLKGTSFDRNSGSMHLLMDHAIKHYRTNEKDCLFDFGGGQIETLARFYQGFGAVPLKYCIFKFNKFKVFKTWMKD